MIYSCFDPARGLYDYFVDDEQLPVNGDLPVPRLRDRTKIGFPSMDAARPFPTASRPEGSGWHPRGIIVTCPSRKGLGGLSYRDGLTLGAIFGAPLVGAAAGAVVGHSWGRSGATAGAAIGSALGLAVPVGVGVSTEVGLLGGKATDLFTAPLVASMVALVAGATGAAYIADPHGRAATAIAAAAGAGMLGLLVGHVTQLLTQTPGETT